ncbi:RipA family octameric membrane protein [Telmatospirillum siberiense]|uniref:RipA family octameric membrane protein n=1 Tax=Telmatospirillum siberiense TaxID=382514 RepID=UPI0011AFB42F|nr:hypothetical protein [Telmatospirillum siberiense]
MTPDEYGDKFSDHKFEQYKLFIQKSENEKNGRFQVHKFYLWIISAQLLSIASLWGVRKSINFNLYVEIILLILASMAIASALWAYCSSHMAKAYRKQIHIILNMEKFLPISPYSQEIEMLFGEKIGNNALLHDKESNLVCALTISIWAVCATIVIFLFFYRL